MFIVSHTDRIESATAGLVADLNQLQPDEQKSPLFHIDWPPDLQTDTLTLRVER